MAGRLDKVGHAISRACGWLLVVMAFAAAIVVAAMLGALVWAGSR